MKIIKNDEAVSPVIGVILMVAITVILAAVIAAFVFGMAGTTSTSKNVGLTASKLNTTEFQITVQGGTDLPSLQELAYTTNTSNPVIYAAGTFAVGNSSIVTAPTNTGVTLKVVGKFSDGSSQVLFSRQF